MLEIRNYDKTSFLLELKNHMRICNKAKKYKKHSALKIDFISKSRFY